MRISDWSSDVCSSDLDEFQTIRRTSEFFQTPLDVRHQTNAFFLGVHVDEVAVRYLRSEVTAVFRLPGREQDWVALRRTRHIQWPFDRQIFALVVEDMNASGIEILTRLLRSEEHTSELQSLMRNSYAF